jgi:hypothetical protein
MDSREAVSITGEGAKEAKEAVVDETIYFSGPQPTKEYEVSRINIFMGLNIALDFKINK